MAGILTLPSSTAAPAPAAAAAQNQKAPPTSTLPVPTPPGGPQLAGDVLNFKGADTPAAPLHSNSVIADALAKAAAPIAPDPVNSILGPAFYRGMNSAPQPSYYQPRAVAPVPRARNSQG